MKLYFMKSVQFEGLVGRVFRDDRSFSVFTWVLNGGIKFSHNPSDAAELTTFVLNNILNENVYHNVGEAAKMYVAKNFNAVIPVNKPAVNNTDNTVAMLTNKVAELEAKLEECRLLEVKHSEDLQKARAQAQKYYFMLEKKDSSAELEVAYKRLYNENKLLKAQVKALVNKRAAKVDQDAIVDRNLDALSICHIIRVLGEAKDMFIGMTHKEKLSICMKKAWAYKKGEIDLTAAVLAGIKESIVEENYDDLEYTNEDEQVVEPEVIEYDPEAIANDYFNRGLSASDFESDYIHGEFEGMEQQMSANIYIAIMQMIAAAANNVEPEEEEEEDDTMPESDDKLTLYLSYNKSTHISHVYEEINGDRVSVANFKSAGDKEAAYKNFVITYCKKLNDPKYKDATLLLTRSAKELLMSKVFLKRHVINNNITIVEVE